MIGEVDCFGYIESFDKEKEISITDIRSATIYFGIFLAFFIFIFSDSLLRVRIVWHQENSYIFWINVDIHVNVCHTPVSFLDLPSQLSGQQQGEPWERLKFECRT